MKFRFGARSVASITASLAWIVEELNAHAEAQIAIAGTHKAKIADLKKRQEEAEAEIVKAKTAADKIAALLA